MDSLKIWEHIYATLQGNKEYMETVELIRELEPDYLAVLDSLTDIQHHQVEKYISACDVQSDSMILHAYRLGYEAGRGHSFLIRSK